MAHRSPNEIERLVENDPGKESAGQTCAGRLQNGHPTGKAKPMDWVEVMIWVFVGFCFTAFAASGYLLWAKGHGVSPG